MTFIVETGTGISQATSYLSQEVADAHFAALGLAEWTRANDANKQRALMQASAYVDGYVYGGSLLNIAQGLSWPRQGAHDREGRVLNGLPHALRTAVLEMAALYVAKPPAAQGTSYIIREKVGPIELAYSKSKQQPSFVFRLLQQIGARPPMNMVQRG
ncbi:DnaT-like ssDNA-binding protein [Sneathiella sp.]|jgi:hypothetical protein|uniref:DnaT-like ssDNA-binding protein n=1 Tax=Sneathiella sp. TaxID=1964365 RepID=UPI0039E5EC09